MCSGKLKRGSDLLRMCMRSRVRYGRGRTVFHKRVDCESLFCADVLCRYTVNFKVEFSEER